MLSIRKSLLKQSIRDNAHTIRHECGRYQTADELIAATEKAGHFVATGAKRIAHNRGFKLSPRCKPRIVFVTPAQMGFSKQVTPPELVARGWQLDLGVCPESLAFEVQNWSFTPLNRKPYLYAVRHFAPELSWVFPEIIPVEDPVYAISTWHGQTIVPLDMSVGFLLPEDIGTD